MATDPLPPAGGGRRLPLTAAGILAALVALGAAFAFGGCLRGP